LSGKFDFYLSIAHDKGLCALVKRCKPNHINTENTGQKLSGAFRSYPHLGHGLGQTLLLHG